MDRHIGRIMNTNKRRRRLTTVWVNEVVKPLTNLAIVKSTLSAVLKVFEEKGGETNG